LPGTQKGTNAQVKHHSAEENVAKERGQWQTCNARFPKLSSDLKKIASAAAFSASAFDLAF